MHPAVFETINYLTEEEKYAQSFIRGYTDSRRGKRIPTSDFYPHIATDIVVLIFPFIGTPEFEMDRTPP